MVKIGDVIRIISDNDTYDRFRDRLWTVEHIAHSKAEHPGYDSAIGEALVDCAGLPVSLYEYEFEIVT